MNASYLATASRLLSRVSLSVLSLLFLSQALAGATKADMVDKYQAGSQYLAYPVPAYGIPRLTPAPEGYVPFHMEHYGRHGSRWLLYDANYSNPVYYLAKADSCGKLTPRGQELLAQLRKIQEDSRDRIGELTPLGHRQHREIARRMTGNFPEIFIPGTHVDAKSTVVIRCILSMANEIAELQAICPELVITCDASRTTQKILAYNSSDTVAKRIIKEADPVVEEFAKGHDDHSAFIAKVFNDPLWVADSLDHTKVFRAVFDVAVNTQSHDDQPDLYDVFTPEELHEEWLNRNADWYVTAGNTPLTNHRVPFNQRVLLRNIIESADTAMVSPRLSANLRFGHESILLPLTVFLELNDAAYSTDSLATVADHWRNYRIFPMGSNLQFIFYRPSSDAVLTPGEVLVKVLLNEAEATLPVSPAPGIGAPYYRWADLRDYYVTKLDSFTTRFPE